MSACLFKAWRNRRREYVPIAAQGNARFCWVLVSDVSERHIFSPQVSPLHGTDFIKMKSEFVRICGFSDLMALPSVDFLTPLPLCLFLRIFKQNFLPCSYLHKSFICAKKQKAAALVQSHRAAAFFLCYVILSEWWSWYYCHARREEYHQGYLLRLLLRRQRCPLLL